MYEHRSMPLLPRRAFVRRLLADHYEEIPPAGRSLPGWQRHVVLTALAYSFLQLERRRRGQTRLTLPRVRAVMQEVLTAHFFMTQPHYLKWMLELKEIELRR